MMRVISVGGGDHAVFQWRYLPEGSHGDDGDEADGGAYLESNSDDSDSEASDVDELDSDVENVSQNTIKIVINKLFIYQFLRSVRVEPTCIILHSSQMLERLNSYLPTVPI